jgi:hypothetical protein
MMFIPMLVILKSKVHNSCFLYASITHKDEPMLLTIADKWLEM